MAPTGRQARTASALDRLRGAIAGGQFGDDMLPGERDLAARLDVSRTTLRRMVADLVAEGVLRHRQGVGTFIARTGGTTHPAPPPGRLAGFAHEMRERGVALASRVIDRAIVLPTPDEAMMLACAAGERILRLTRLRAVGALVLSVERAAVPCRFIGGSEAPEASLYAALAARGHPPVRALQRVQAAAVTEDEAGLLGVAVGATGVSVRRAAYLADGACCDFTRAIYPAARYDAMSEVRLPALADPG